MIFFLFYHLKIKYFSKGSSKYGSVEVVEYFINKGAKNLKGALSMAISYGNKEVAMYLISKGEKIKKEYIQYACETGNVSLVEYLYENSENESEDIFCYSLHSHFYSLSLFLFDLGADIDFVDDSNQTPIELSFQSENKYLIFFLFYFGVHFSPEIQQKCLRKIQPEKSDFSEIISDYNKGTIWKKETNKYFPSQMKSNLKTFLISLEINKTKTNMKIPKPIITLIIQKYATMQIKINKEKREKTKK